MGVFFFKLNKDFSKKDKDFIQKVCMNVSFASYRYYRTSIFFLCYSWLVLTSWIYISKRGVGGMLLWIKPFLYGAVTNVDSAHINVRRRCVIIFWMVKKLSVGWMERWWKLGLISGIVSLCLEQNFLSVFCLNSSLLFVKIKDSRMNECYLPFILECWMKGAFHIIWRYQTRKL